MMFDQGTENAAHGSIPCAALYCVSIELRPLGVTECFRFSEY